MKVEFAIAGSPNDAFFSQMAMFRLALSDLGGTYKAARVICVFGDSEVQPIPERWREAFRDIDVVWVDPEDFNRRYFIAQSVRRFAAFSESADVAILIDADTLPMATFDRLLKEAKSTPAIRASLALKQPALGGAPVDWAALAARLGLPVTSALQTPFYINAGVLMGPPAMFAEFEPALEQTRNALVKEYPGDKDATFFGGQIAIALTAHAMDLPCRTIPLRYNFPNFPQAAALYPGEFERMKICHFFHQVDIQRWEIFSSGSGFQRFLNAELSDANRLLQDRVRKLTGGVYPFPELKGSVHVNRPDLFPDHGSFRMLPPFVANGTTEGDDPLPLAHYTGWSRAMISRNNWRAAKDMAVKATSYYPEAADAQAALGEALLAGGDAAGAIALLKLALEKDAGKAPYASSLSLAYEAEGQIEDAVRYAQMANAISPDDADTYLRLGDLAAGAKPDASLDYYRRGLRLDPDNAALHGGMSDVLESLDRLDDATQARARAVELAPAKAAHHFRMGRLLLKSKSPGLAKLFFLDAVRLKPGQVNALQSLSKIYEAEGRIDAAIDAVERAISHARGNKKLANRLKKLRVRLDDSA